MLRAGRVQLCRLVVAAAMVASAAAQDASLASRVRAPLLYLAVEPGLPKAPSSVRAEHLLADPALLSALGLEQRPSPESDAGSTLLRLRRLVGGVAAAGGEIELALVGVLPRVGAPSLPLLVFRAALGGEASARMRALLEDERFARPHRRSGPHQVHALQSLGSPRPGALIEVASFGDDLFVSNHMAAMDGALGAGGTAAAPVLVAETGYESLREQLEVTPGSLVLYVDFERLRHHLGPSLSGTTHWLLNWSGLASARRVVCAIRPGADGLRTTILLDDGGRPDGWLALARAQRLADVVQRLPRTGLGGFAFAVEPADVLRSDPGRGHGRGLDALRSSLVGGCARIGLDPDAQVLRRLGDAVAVGVVRVDGGPASAAPVFCLHAKSAAAARSLFVECKELARPKGAVSLDASAPRGDRLVLLPSGQFPLYLAVQRDALVLAFEAGAIDRFLSAPPAPAESARDVSASLQRIGAGKADVLGVFAVDLAELNTEPSDSAQPSYLLRRHVGFLARGTQLTRIEVITDA